MTNEEEIKHPIFADSFRTFSWCLHCERAERTENWLSKKACPYCSASLLDQWRWEQVREANPDYPATPEMGKEYPLYG